MIFTNVVPPPFDESAGFVPCYRRSDDETVTSIWGKLRARGIGASMAVRTEAARSVGGFDESMGPGGRFPDCDDGDMAVRLLLSGWDIHEDAGGRGRPPRLSDLGAGAGADQAELGRDRGHVCQALEGRAVGCPSSGPLRVRRDRNRWADSGPCWLGGVPRACASPGSSSSASAGRGDGRLIGTPCASFRTPPRSPGHRQPIRSAADNGGR